MAISPFFRRRALRSLLRGVLRYVWGRRGQRRVHGWRLLYRLRTEVLLRGGSTIHGIARAADVRLWVDREAFPRIHRLLRRARHTVFIQMFIWKDDPLGRSMAETLLTIADRGVMVEIQKEAVGDVFELHRDFLTTQYADDPLWRRFWTHPNIRIAYGVFNDHAKVYIIDDRILLLTGMNIAEEYHSRLHDYLVELRGTEFVEYYLTHGEVGRQPKGVQIVMNAENRRDIRPTLMGLLRSAEKSIVLEHCYLSDPKVIDLLLEQSHKGIRVTVIVPRETGVHHHTNMQSVARLVAEGAPKTMQVFLYPGMFHGKIVLVDHRRAFLGSANLMTSSLDDMGEVNVLLDEGGARALLKLRDVLRENILRSRLLTSPPPLHWLGKWLAWVRL